jgi:hypothetical protein
MPSEVEIFISILENQRNVAMTELARMAARISVLETQLAAMQAKQETETGSA